MWSDTEAHLPEHRLPITHPPTPTSLSPQDGLIKEFLPCKCLCDDADADADDNDDDNAVIFPFLVWLLQPSDMTLSLFTAC